jgi:hypothetical protein
MTPDPLDDWAHLKPDAEVALAELLGQLQDASPDSPNQDVLDSYLYAKGVIADAMKAFIRIGLDERCKEFHDLRAKLAEEMRRRYSGRVPDAYLSVPYGSKVHEQLFALLLKRIGTPVQAAMLRIVTADSVHTERRTRELRELGLDISGFTENSIDVYQLNSLGIDTSMIPTLIVNRARSDRFRKIPEAELGTALTETDRLTD